MKKIPTVIPLIILLCFTFGCQKKNEEELTVEEARGILDDFLKLRNDGDLAAADRVMHPECVIRYSNLPEEIVGLEAYKEYDRTTRIAFPDFTMTIDDFFAKGNKLVSYWSLNATNTGPLMTPLGELPPTNKKIQVSGIAVTLIVDGKIKEDDAFFDMLNMMQQLGMEHKPKVKEGD